MASAMAFSCTDPSSEAANRAHKASIIPTSTQDSIPALHSVGVSSLISDSGVIRYHLVAEEWDIHTPNGQAATWVFKKGLLMLRLDTDLKVDLYVQADTAYLHKQNLWELRGRVRIRNLEGTKFNTEELFWDLNTREIWNHAHMLIITPERTLQGTEFRSNEKMTRYSVMNSSGDFPMADEENAPPATADTTDTTATPTAESPKMPGTVRQRAPNASGIPVMEPAPSKYEFMKKEK